MVFGHTDDAPGAIRDGSTSWSMSGATPRPLCRPRSLRSFQEGNLLTWATHLKIGASLDDMIADAVRRGIYLNPTMTYEWGGLSPARP